MTNPNEPRDKKLDGLTLGPVPRFILAFLTIALLNFGPTLVTWRAFRTDGMEQTGFPFVFYERGGLSYHESLELNWLVADMMVALTAAAIVAYPLRNGWRSA